MADIPTGTDVHNPLQNLASAAANASSKFHDELHQVTVYGVTNRHLSDDGKAFSDGELQVNKDDEIHYYKETVPVARSKDKGEYKATGPGTIEVIDKAQFDRETQTAVGDAGKQLGIYFHGIRNAVGEPGQKAAEISADSGKPFIVEDWASTAPSQSKSIFAALNIPTQQMADYQSSFESQAMLNQSTEELLDKFGAANVDLVAHSRGSVNEARLLGDLQAKGKEPVKSATFAHSDIDVTDFAHAFPDIYKGARHINVLYNPNDTALNLSAMQKQGKANLNDGCTITDSQRLGSCGLSDQYLQNQAKDYVGKGYFLSIKDVPAKDQDDYGHSLGSKKMADILTTPGIYSSNKNEIKDGPQYKAIDPAACKIGLTESEATKQADNGKSGAKAEGKAGVGENGTPGGKTDTTSEVKPVILDQDQVRRDFVSMSPEVSASRTQRLAALNKPHWLPYENIWAANDTPATK